MWFRGWRRMKLCAEGAQILVLQYGLQNSALSSCLFSSEELCTSQNIYDCAYRSSLYVHFLACFHRVNPGKKGHKTFKVFAKGTLSLYAFLTNCIGASRNTNIRTCLRLFPIFTLSFFVVDVDNVEGFKIFERFGIFFTWHAALNRTVKLLKVMLNNQL